MTARDAIHLGLMLGALLVAYLLPFELLVLSYAILGPAHYLTEISWLHDHDFYLPQRNLAGLLVFAAFGAMFIASPYSYGLLIVACFCVCAILAARPPLLQGALSIAAAVVLILGAAQFDAPFIAAGILLTTLIHVSLFTLIFMLTGAQRNKSTVQFALAGAYVAAIALIVVVPPSSRTAVPVLGAFSQTYFGDVAPVLGSLFGHPQQAFDSRIAGFLSFAYTYHYLNWFIKADIIGWIRMPTRRLAAIAAASAAGTALYFYNYAAGFMVLLLLSLLHILLEFPLDSIAIRQLAGWGGHGAATRRAMPKKRRPAASRPA